MYYIVGQQKIIANTELNLSKDEADDRAPLIDYECFRTASAPAY